MNMLYANQNTAVIGVAVMQAWPCAIKALVEKVNGTSKIDINTNTKRVRIRPMMWCTGVSNFW